MADGDSIANRLDSTVWAGIGCLGILVFVLGVYRPALAGVAYSEYFEVVLAVVGACIAVAGFSFALDQRKAEQARPKRIRRAHAELTDEFGPSFQVYDPKTAQESVLPPEPEPGPEPPANP